MQTQFIQLATLEAISALGSHAALTPHCYDQSVLVVHVQYGGTGGTMSGQPCDSVRVGFGQRLVPHERVDELAVIEVLDAVTHGRTLSLPTASRNLSSLICACFNCGRHDNQIGAVTGRRGFAT